MARNKPADEDNNVPKRLATEYSAPISPTANPGDGSTSVPPAKASCSGVQHTVPITAVGSADAVQTVLNAIKRVECWFGGRISSLEDSITGRIRHVVAEELVSIREDLEAEIGELKVRICAVEDRDRQQVQEAVSASSGPLWQPKPRFVIPVPTQRWE